MVYLLGTALVVAFIAARYLTLKWKPAGDLGGRRNLPLETALYAARSALSLGLLAATFVFLLLRAGETPVLFAAVSGPAATLPSAVGVLFSLLVLAQVSRVGRLPEFLGLSTQRRVLFVDGMFSLCRHPMYAGWLLALWGLLLSAPYVLTVLVCSLLTLSFVLEAVHEERAMVNHFGDYYRRYQAAVPFLMPYGFLKRKPVDEARRQPAAEPPPSPRREKRESVHRRQSHR